MMRALSGLVLLGFGCWLVPPAGAQQIDFSRGGPIAITAAEGIEWNQNEQRVVARGEAKAVRGNVTVSADRLIAYYRKRAGAAGPAAPSVPAAAPAATANPGRPGAIAGGAEAAGNEIYRVEAIGRVHITSGTEQVWGERAVYDMDQAVMLMTGGALKLITPNQTLTARDSLEYWAQKRMSVARGNAVVVTADGRRVQADTLVAYSRDDGGRVAPAGGPTGGPTGAPTSGSVSQPIAGSGKLQRVEAFGNVLIRTATDTVVGDRAVYIADSGLARLGGNVRITRGQNQFAGADAVVNTNTGVAQLLAGATGRVAGIVMPADTAGQADPASEPPPATPPPRPPRRRGNQP